MKRIRGIFAALFFGCFVFGIWYFTGNRTVQKLPSDFPDIPVYTNAVLVSTNKTISNSGDGYVGIWKSEKNVSDITGWYSTSLKNSGWTIDIAPENTASNEIQYLVAKKSDTVVQLSVLRSQNGGTEITTSFPVNYGNSDN